MGIDPAKKDCYYFFPSDDKPENYLVLRKEEIFDISTLQKIKFNIHDEHFIDEHSTGLICVRTSDLAIGRVFCYQLDALDYLRKIEENDEVALYTNLERKKKCFKNIYNFIYS